VNFETLIGLRNIQGKARLSREQNNTSGEILYFKGPFSLGRDNVRALLSVHFSKSSTPFLDVVQREKFAPNFFLRSESAVRRGHFCGFSLCQLCKLAVFNFSRDVRQPSCNCASIQVAERVPKAPLLSCVGPSPFGLVPPFFFFSFC